MSSGVPVLTVRVSPEPSAPPVAVTTEPKALNSTLASDRPIALLIIRVSRMPDAPTRVPAMISRLLLRVKPEAATASPVNEFSSEMSTGTSAPPIGQHEDHAQHQRQERPWPPAGERCRSPGCRWPAPRWPRRRWR